MHQAIPHTRRAAVVLGVLLAALALIAGCARGGGGDREYLEAEAEQVVLAGEQRTVKIGVLRQPHLSHALFYDAYVPENVSLEVIPFANSTEIKNAIVSGDIAFGVTGITAALQGAANGEPVVVVAGAADGGSAIIVGEDSGIESVDGLRGKRIGYVPGSAQDILLRLTLREAGLDPLSDVELTNVQFADMAPALVRGDIDAFSGAETGPSEAIVAGSGRVLVHPYETPMGKINISLVTNQSLIDSDPELVQAMVAVHAKATDYMLANTDLWAQAVASEYGFSEEALAIAVENIELRWDIDQTYADQAAVLGAEQFALGQITTEPDYSAFVDLTFVNAIE